MTTRWRIHVDTAQCIGSGVCISCAPQHFALVDGKAEPIAELVDPVDEVSAAVESCPMEAVRVRAVESRTEADDG